MKRATLFIACFTIVMFSMASSKAFAAGSYVPEGDSLKIGFASGLDKLASTWAEEFTKRNPGLDIEITRVDEDGDKIMLGDEVDLIFVTEESPVYWEETRCGKWSWQGMSSFL